MRIEECVVVTSPIGLNETSPAASSEQRAKVGEESSRTGEQRAKSRPGRIKVAPLVGAVETMELGGLVSGLGSLVEGLVVIGAESPPEMNRVGFGGMEVGTTAEKGLGAEAAETAPVLGHIQLDLSMRSE